MSAAHSTSIHRKRTVCRACGGDRLWMFLSLGEMPLANAFLAGPEEFDRELRFPLEVYFCKSCTLVQLLDVIDPEVLFSHYVYVTGASATMLEHNQRYADAVADYLGLGPEDLVIEVASNDGSLLKQFQRRRIRALGIEPARNIAEQARRDGVPTVERFFNSEVARELRSEYGPAKAVIANNVLAHVDETVDFLCGARELLADGGLVILEVPHLQELIARLEYDTIYHEHLCYFSAATLMRLAEAAGLTVVRLDRVPVHGGSLRIWAGVARRPGAHGADAHAIAEQERRLGLQDAARYEQFAADVARNRSRLVELLESLRASGKTLAGYGAPAKGNTLLNYCRVGPELLPYTVDKNPLKVGRYTPGMHIPVLPVATLCERRPDYVLILAWNIADEIFAQQEDYRRGGGRFLVPIPEPRIFDV